MNILSGGIRLSVSSMNRILAAVTDSPMADKVMSHVEGLVRELGSDLVLLSIIDSDPMKTQSIVGDTVQLKALHHRLLSKHFEENKLSKDSESPLDARYGYRVGDHKIRIDSRIIQGNPVEKICQVADEQDVRMVIVGSRALGNIGTLSFESVSENLVRKCARPVLVVKDEAADYSSFEGPPAKSALGMS